MEPDLSADRPPMVAVASGKGGVGKSTVVVNLGIALRDLGLRVGIVDADLHGPDIARLLNRTRTRDASGVLLWTNPHLEDARPAPVDVHGLGVISAQFLLGEGQALAVDATLTGLLLDRFVNVVDWSGFDIILVDLPPGTGDQLQRLAAFPQVVGALVVVTPQDLAHLDARKVVGALERLGVPILGGVENMTSFECSHCGHSEELFAPTPFDRSIWSNGVQRLAQLPFSSAIRMSESSGRPAALDRPASLVGEIFSHLAATVLRLLADHDEPIVAGLSRRAGLS